MERGLKNKPFSHHLSFWKGRGRGLEATEVAQGPPRHGSSLFTVRLTQLVKVTPSLCWLQDLVNFSDITQRSAFQDEKGRHSLIQWQGTTVWKGRCVGCLCGKASHYLLYHLERWSSSFFTAFIRITWNSSTCVQSVITDDSPALLIPRFFFQRG